jgi:hypothetical protein
MIDLNNVTELLELLSSEQKELIIKEQSNYIVLNLHQSSSKGPFVTFLFTDNASQYQATELRAILPLAPVAMELRDAWQRELCIKLYTALKRKLSTKQQ